MTASNLFKRENIKLNDKMFKVSVFLNYSVLDQEFIHLIVAGKDEKEYSITI